MFLYGRHHIPAYSGHLNLYLSSHPYWNPATTWIPVGFTQWNVQNISVPNIKLKTNWSLYLGRAASKPWTLSLLLLYFCFFVVSEQIPIIQIRIRHMLYFFGIPLSSIYFPLFSKFRMPQWHCSPWHSFPCPVKFRNGFVNFSMVFWIFLLYWLKSLGQLFQLRAKFPDVLSPWSALEPYCWEKYTAFRSF